MSSPRMIALLDALTTRNGALIGAAAILAIGSVVTLASSPADSTTGPLRTAQAAPADAPSSGQGAFNAEQTKAIEQIVKDYLLKNPDILVEVGKELEKRQSLLQMAEHKTYILSNRKAIFEASTDYVMGNPKGDITVVEFFDYNCGWCKRAVDELTKLSKADPNIKIVFKEFPIFGEHSTFAAKAAMASQKQGKYWEFHVALMSERQQVTRDTVLRVASKIGLDVEKLKADMADPALDAAIKSTSEIAQSLGIEGTPGFIVDAKVNVGFLPAEGLKQLIAEARQNGCQVC